LAQLANSMVEQTLLFGPYSLHRSQKMLKKGDERLQLGSRAMTLLIALVDRAGEVVSKKELMQTVWPNTVVEQNNLRVHLTMIRKVLDDADGTRYIINVAGRGYSFIAPITLLRESEVPSSTQIQERGEDLPQPNTRVVGRDEAIARVLENMSRRRLVTISGPGGVGKTTVALAVARLLCPPYEQVRFVELARTEDPLLIPFALATALGIAAPARNATATLIAYLKDQEILIVLDNCEHVVVAVAQLVELILNGTERVGVLATSREPLLTEGEFVYNLAPLGLPPDVPVLTAERALQHASVQLFVERAVKSLDSFALTDGNAAAVAAICRRLDGIPLSIELVATRVNLFGIEALARGFGDQMILTAQGRRTADSRHQSLRATMDWSFRTLGAIEQMIFRRLAVFRGSFTAASAAAVVSENAPAGAPVLDGLMALVSKSMLAAEVSGKSIRYRLLYVTRAYASELLDESTEGQEISRRHCAHICEILEKTLSDWETLTGEQWLGRYGGMIDDVRAALNWAFSENGDLELAATLTFASLPFGFQISPISETMNRVTIALDVLSSRVPPKPRWEIRLHNVRVALLYAAGAPAASWLGAVDDSLRLANEVGVTKDLIVPMTSRAGGQFTNGDYATARTSAEALVEVARRTADPVAVLMADRVRAQTSHYAGDHGNARSLAQRVLRSPERHIPMVYGQTLIDPKVSMRIILARVLWIEGYADQAVQVADEAVDLAASDGPAAMLQALGLAACPVALWRGDMSSALGFIESLLDWGQRYAFSPWSKLALCYKATVNLHPIEVPVGIGAATIAPDASGISRRDQDTLATIAAYWIDGPTLDRARRGLCGWAGPEIMRAATARALRAIRSDADLTAESSYLDALHCAQQHGALAWQLRIAMSLAEFWSERGRLIEARNSLRTVLDRFTEGFGTADLATARQLLDRMETPT